MKIRYISSLSFVFLVIAGFSCKKLVQVPPPSTAVTGNSVYSSDATAIAVLTGLYGEMSASSTSTIGEVSSLSLYGGLSSDELTLWSGATDPVAIADYQNALRTGTMGIGSEYWYSFYSHIFVCNDAIQNLNASSGLTPSVKMQLLGESLFMRAFFYFYLANLYGDVALSTTTDYKTNKLLGRAPVSQVYQQVIADLKEAETLLSPTYTDATLQKPSTDRVRPSKWAAAALLARVYLYTRDWVNAEAQSNIVLGNTSLFSLSSLDSTFLKASSGNNEAIWQLQPVNINWNTEDAKVFIMTTDGPGQGLNFGAYLSDTLLNTFEANDQRRYNGNWIDSVNAGGGIYFFPYKYKVNTSGSPVTEYLTILRLGEQYLIRAEARAQQGNLSGAEDDLNKIRARAGLGNTAATTQGDLLSTILHERQVELFTEFGQRWLDLKRSGTVDEVMSGITPLKIGAGKWNSYQQLYPVSFNDIQVDHNLTQNPGYQ